MKILRYCLLVLIPPAIMLCLASCHRNTPKLVIGFIKPSINHLPLSFALEQNPRDKEKYQLVSFASGWEVQEAMAAGKLDMAIMPFTYAWTLRSRGYKVKTLACLERETDGIVTTDKIKTPADLNGTRIGLLRASSLEALLDDYTNKNAISFTPVHFRTPAELTEALVSGNLDAIVSYVPLIQKMPDNLHVLHWFADDYPAHPCCNLVVTEAALLSKPKQVQKLNALLQTGIDAYSSESAVARGYLATYFSLTPKQTASALQHVKFQSYISEQDAAFERKMMQDFVRKGYLTGLPADNDMYYLPRD